MRHTIPDKIDDVQLRQLTITSEAEIIRRYNAHAELVEVLSGLVRLCEAVQFSMTLGKNQVERIAKARAALSAAKEGTK